MLTPLFRAEHFRIVRLLARGDVTEVHEALATDADGVEHKVAVERLVATARKDAQMRGCFVDRAKAVLELKHPNLVRVLDQGADDEGPYAVLELAQGMTAAQLVKRDEDDATDEVPPGVVLHIVTEVARGLEHLHRVAGLVHRDVSPENILLTWSGEAKLCGFGIVGSGADDDPRSDVFDLGCALHTMLTGKSALSDDAELPSDIRTIIERATRFDRRERYPTAHALAAATNAAMRLRSNVAGQTLLSERLSSLRPTSGMNFGVASGQSSDDRIRDPTSYVGERIGGYFIDELIGYGGSAFVFKARDLDDQIVALKLLRQNKSATAEERLRREARSLRRLAHPNIVDILEIGEVEDGRPYLVLEYFESRNLDRTLRDDGPFDLVRTIEVSRSIAGALASAHDAGIVHRDLKPANILVGAGGTIKLTDFGVARATDGALMDTRLTRHQQLLGTPSYMAPEQIRDPHNVSPASDLYGLGAVMFRMLSGRPPFVGRPNDILDGHLKHPPPPLAQAGALEPLIHQLLAKDPKDRPRTARDVLHAIRDDQTLLVAPVIVQHSGRHIRQTALMALVALLIAFALGLLFGIERRAIEPAPTAPVPRLGR